MQKCPGDVCCCVQQPTFAFTHKSGAGWGGGYEIPNIPENKTRCGFGLERIKSRENAPRAKSKNRQVGPRGSAQWLVLFAKKELRNDHNTEPGADLTRTPFVSLWIPGAPACT